MKNKRTASRWVLMLGSAVLPLCAQTPLFTDGPAFGGSKVFSEGRNPLGNSARFDQPAPGLYFSYLDGDQRAQDNQALLKDALAFVPGALVKLQDAPWAQRTRAYGLASIRESVNIAYTREEHNGMTVFPDIDPARLGTPSNSTLVTGRRSAVDRISFGGATTQSGTAFGATLRIEQWRTGLRTAALNPVGTQLPMTDLEKNLLAATGTDQKALVYAMDLGYTMELAQGLRIGLTVDQLNAKRLWDVQLKPQFRAGLQFDLGSMATMSLESDINATARMPFPDKQKTASASLRLAASPAVAFILGAERRKVGESTVTRAGVTLQLRTQAFLLGLGMQIGQDLPLRGATLMVN